MEPSEYFPVAVNCCVAPTAKLAELSGDAAATAMEDNVAAVDVGDEQATTSKSKMAINPIATQ